MEPRRDVLKKTPEKRKEKRARRLHIVKLEERIAPCIHTNPQGKEVGTGLFNGRHCGP